MGGGGGGGGCRVVLELACWCHSILGQIFMLIDASDGFSADARFKLFRSFGQVTQDSQKTRLLLTDDPVSVLS